MDSFNENFKQVEREMESTIRRLKEEMDRIEQVMEEHFMAVSDQARRRLQYERTTNMLSGEYNQVGEEIESIKNDMRRLRTEMERMKREMNSFTQDTIERSSSRSPSVPIRGDKRSDSSSIQREFDQIEQQIEDERKRMEEDMNRMKNDVERMISESGFITNKLPTGINYPCTEDRQLFNRDTLPWRLAEDPLVQNNSRGNRLDLKIDLREYAPEEIFVNVENNRLVILAAQNKKDGTRNIKKAFKYETNLPEGISADKLDKKFSSDGILNIQASLPEYIQQ
ncbi:uncharacterized protein LOC111624201 isoform X2 [Centruroides sculpturatus]|uniref:uncharacterized protein LOC111624201 isoform X2 n=1 Tax=Centruroides sculpturatus TaxID=218467 RepID=UPI000C6E3BEA|nr:uncharacterized protein LOC111624201 isoform X2 [Centruroides sculpturatus]